jgi:hypothetical protein
MATDDLTLLDLSICTDGLAIAPSPLGVVSPDCITITYIAQ